MWPRKPKIFTFCSIPGKGCPPGTVVDSWCPAEQRHSWGHTAVQQENFHKKAWLQIPGTLPTTTHARADMTVSQTQT